MNNREEAISWFKNLDLKEQKNYMFNCRAFIISYDTRDPEMLTGREIEEIYHFINFT